MKKFLLLVSLFIVFFTINLYPLRSGSFISASGDIQIILQATKSDGTYSEGKFIVYTSDGEEARGTYRVSRNGVLDMRIDGVLWQKGTVISDDEFSIGNARYTRK